MPSETISLEKLAHLSDEQKTELLTLLDRYAACFSDQPGFTDAAVHHVNVTPDFRPKRQAEYRIPERLKPEVDRQIAEMLKLGIIRKSNSANVSPVVCVLKGPGGRDGVRLAVDLRYTNRYTVADEFPLPDIGTLLQEVGQAEYISVMDCRQGYWQTAVNPDHTWLYAFICNGALYEFVRTPFGGKKFWGHVFTSYGGNFGADSRIREEFRGRPDSP